MPDDSAQEKTLPPTPERLRKARAEGKVPQSREFPTVMGIFALLLILVLFGSAVFGFLIDQMSFWLGNLRTPRFDAAFARLVLTHQLKAVTGVLTPVMCLAVVGGIISSLVPGGIVFSIKATKWDLKNISAISGFKRLFSLKSATTMLSAIAKIAVILVVSYFYLSGRMDRLGLLVGASPRGLVEVAGGLALGLAFRIAATMLIIAIADIMYQKWQYIKDLRMTRQEVKEERKSHEMDSKVKQRMFVLKLEMMRKQMLKDVQTADVVVVNPDHYAVALKYNPLEMDAPTVVAKGIDYLAQKIRELAREHGVPVVERPPLARALYAAVEVGVSVPEELFVAVANILAYIYRSKKNV